MKTALSLAVALLGLVVGAGAQHDPRTIERKLVRCKIVLLVFDPRMSLRFFNIPIPSSTFLQFALLHTSSATPWIYSMMKLKVV